ncbi:MAG: Putative two-component sensor histidine kinase [uncultured Sulfurovum sp.]|uniref:histidine kinase n=1 Tax=uncultured Sulfurovum sp. TaxID=269237 RepID=A0A6S6UEH7_9BACT|nr:MAG: Putative two-component sensor histidine kinase [uncultured Sulfurovum sp.]
MDEKEVQHCLSSKEEQSLLQQQAKMAAMGEMIGNIAHQWRQPLNALSALNVGLGMKHRNGKLTDAEVQKFKEKSNTIIQNMSSTIEDFKNFFQPDKIQETFEIHEAVEGAIRFVSDAYNTHSIQVQVNIQDKILVRSYKNELMQVLLNIFNNTKDAVIEKKIDNGMVTINMSESKNKVIITLQDNAGGVSTEVLEKMYEPYFTTKFESHGTGIGLYMSKMIIEKSMNGSLESENREDGLLTTIIIEKETKEWVYSI